MLAVAELHGIRVDEPERARPLVLGTLLGQKSQSQISKMVLSAVGIGGVSAARDAASGVVSKSTPKGWGDVLTQQLPDSALAPLTIAIGRESIKLGGKLGAGTVGKTIPFGVGAVIGGLGSFTFGRDVVKSARIAFPAVPTEFPEWLRDYEKLEQEAAEPTRAALAFESAAGTVKDFGENVWGKVSAATKAFRSVDLDGDGIADEARALTALKRAGTGVAGSVAKGAEVFRSVGLDGDGVADEARAVTALKGRRNCRERRGRKGRIVLRGEEEARNRRGCRRAGSRPELTGGLRLSADSRRAAATSPRGRSRHRHPSATTTNAPELCDQAEHDQSQKHEGDHQPVRRALCGPDSGAGGQPDR